MSSPSYTHPVALLYHVSASVAFMQEHSRDLERERVRWEGWERERGELVAQLAKTQETAECLNEEVTVLRGEREAWQELLVSTAWNYHS